MIIIYFGFGPCYRRWIHPETAPLIVSNLHFPLTFSVCTHSDSNPYHAGNMEFTEQNEAKISEISEILTAISRITEPIPGMFVLNWMHFSLWFQIWSWTFTISTFFLQIWLVVLPVVCTRLPRGTILPFPFDPPCLYTYSSDMSLL